MRILVLCLPACQSSLAVQSFQNFGPFMLASDAAERSPRNTWITVAGYRRTPDFAWQQRKTPLHAR